MTAEFVALPVGWVNIYHNKETDKVYAEACPGVVTYTETVMGDTLRIGVRTQMGYASFSAVGAWNLAAKRPHYVMTTFLGEGNNISRAEYDKVIVPETVGNLWELS